MKKSLYLLLFGIFSYTQIIAQGVVSIPNSNFLFILTEYSKTEAVAKDLNGNWVPVDTNGNGKIEVSEAENISYLQIGAAGLNQNFDSLEGIKSFKNLEEIFFYNSTTDMVDLSGLTKLKSISSTISNSIKGLNLSNCTSLKSIFLPASQLSSIKLSGSTNLEQLDISRNVLTSLDLSNLTNLKHIDISANKLTSTILSNCTSLTSLNAASNELNNLDISDCINLNSLELSRNQLTHLDFTKTKNLVNIDCEQNQLISLDVSNLPDLHILHAGNNKLTSLDISNNKKLTGLDISINQLTSLYIQTGTQKDWDNLSIFSMNPDLNYICCDDFDKGIIKTKTNLNGIFPTITSDCGNKTLSTEDFGSESNYSIKITPNPVKDRIHFSKEVKVVEIYDVSGRLILFSIINSNEMNISNLKNGTYIIRVQTDKENYSQKLIKL